MAAPLAGALIYIGQTGDAALGGLALFALGLGMGVPLIIIGTSAGKLLPKAGIWMNSVKSIFGVIMLAVAVWLLQRLLPAFAVMTLWALLLIIPAIYLNALDALPHPTSGWRKLWKGIGVAMLAYGVLLLIGAAADGKDPLQPLRGVGLVETGKAPASASFQKIRAIGELQEALDDAKTKGHWVMLDFYADWCVSCQEMERYTFGDPRVQAKLATMTLLQADVTSNDQEQRALLQRYGLVGPPATLFFDPEGKELRDYRIIGYMRADDFLSHVDQLQGR
jgi:thiol:disulfide interchange protein DsbD